MAFSRAAVLRSSIRGARPTIPRPQLWRQVARRGYASGGHGASSAGGGDALWAASAVAVTVPACWYILKDSPDSSHGHGAHGDDHGKSHSKDHKEESKDEDEDEEKSEASEEKDDDKDAEKSEDSDSGDEKKDTDTPDSSDDEGKGDDSEKADEKDDGPSDKAAAAKPAGDKTTQSGKQEGLSNADTKHSTDIANDPSKSKKGEGMPETAKSKGTVDVKRPGV